MDIGRLRDWVEVVGIFALVASLVFVGLELKQSREIAVAQTHTARTDTVVQHITAGADNPYFLAASAKINAGNAEAITPLEQQALDRTLQAALYLSSDAYYQYKHGFLSSDRWESSRESLKLFMRVNSPYPARELFEHNPNAWGNDFRLVVEQILREVDSENLEEQDSD